MYIGFLEPIKKVFLTVIFLAATRLCLLFHFAFPLLPQSVTAKKFLRSKHPAAKKLWRFKHATAKKFLCFQDSRATDPQLATGSCPACRYKKKFLRMHYFWAVLYVHFKFFVVKNLEPAPLCFLSPALLSNLFSPLQTKLKVCSRYWYYGYTIPL